MAEFVRGRGKRRELLTEDFFTINVQIKKNRNVSFYGKLMPQKQIKSYKDVQWCVG